VSILHSLSIFLSFSESQVFSTSFLEQEDNVTMITMGSGTPPTWCDMQTPQQLKFYKVSLQVCNGESVLSKA